jgi:hypothetical protein
MPTVPNGDAEDCNVRFHQVRTFPLREPRLPTLGRKVWPQGITGAILFPWKGSRASRRSPSGSNDTLQASRAATGTLWSASLPLGHASNADASWNSHPKGVSVSGDIRIARRGAKGSGGMITVR